MRRKVLIVDAVSEVVVEGLRQLGLEVHYLPKWSADECPELLREAYGLVIRGRTKVDEHLLERAPALRFIARAGAGLDQIDQQAAQARQIALIHASEGNAEAVAEHTLGMLLALLHKIVAADRSLRQGLWLREAYRGEELAGKCVALLGFGHTARAVSRRLRAFGCLVCAYDKYVSECSDEHVGLVSIEELQERADVLSIHLPSTKETRHMVDRAFLSAFSKPIFLLNTSRGELLETEALCEALRLGRVRGAALDVFEEEPLELLSEAARKRLDFLIAQENVILTPHIAGWSRESYMRIAEVIVDKIRAFLFSEQSFR